MGNQISVPAGSRDGSVERDASEKWEVQLRKGCLELAILASLWEGRLYGLEILRHMEIGSDLIVSEGTVYPLLTRLRREGLIDATWEESPNGPPRRYYRITRDGRAALKVFCTQWERFRTTVDKILA